MLLLVRVLTFVLFAAPFLVGSDPQAVLVEDVRSIARVGTPGVVAVFGEDAFPVVLGKIDDDVRAPLVAAAPLGSGRIVAFAHTGYFSRDVLSKLDGARFVTNCLRWAAHDTERVVRVRIVGGNDEFAEFLSAQGFQARAADSLRGLEEVDVLIQFGSGALDAEARSSIESFVTSGGGLLVAETPWGWMQLHPGRSLATDHPGNALLMKAGLAWVDGTLDETGSGAFTIADVPELVHASRAVDALLQRSNAQKWPRSRSAQARWSILAPLAVLPREDELLRPKLLKLRAQATSAIPSAATPVKDDATLARIALALDLEEALALPPTQCRAHPAANVFPGSVPPDAQRVTRTIAIDPRVDGWHSTGLYAAPGEVVEIERRASANGPQLSVQIGAHTDDLTDLNQWKRCPRVVVKASLSGEKTLVASPFGGLVYVVVSGRSKKHDAIEITVKHAVEAPRFVLGRTDVAEWKSKLRALPAPWAELETRKVILTLPSHVVRELDDPEALMLFWDRVMDACADLGGLSQDRPRPERYVADEQISAGYMHSGYPIMTHLDVAPTFVDLKKLAVDENGCGWGFYHEMGHNHQESEWTFEGTGEVTNNLFAVYVLDTVVKAEDKRTTAQECRLRFDAYRKNGTKYEDWKDDPFLALGFFLEMKRAFGWKPFQAFFAEEMALSAADKPVSDLAKRTQWLVRMSRLVGRDLTPWFTLWNVPVDAVAARGVTGLPPWVADGYPRD